MKKIFTLAMFVWLLVTLGADAQKLRKTWDFRNGFSSATVEALKADQAEHGADKYWRNYESDAAKFDEQHFWCASKDAKNADGFACTHNGGEEKVIPELEGLTLGFTAAKKFVVTYDGAQAANEASPNGMYPFGTDYVWLNGKNETIKFSAAVNQTIKIGLESHKNTEARGISLSTDNGTLTPKFEGNPTPTYYQDYEWELSGNDGEIATITIKSTNGCHIYYIIVGEGDEVKVTKIAYLYEGTPDATQGYIASLENTEVESIDVATTTKTAEELRAYDVVVVASNVTNAAWANILNAALSWTPIVNTSYALYDAWGLGKSVKQSENLVIINKKGHALFSGIETIDDPDSGISAIVMEGDVYAIQDLNAYFSTDVMAGIGMDGADMITAHIHNANHNAYMYVPAGNQQLMLNAITEAAGSKAEVTAAPKPSIKFEYGNMKTKVIITSSVPGARIYYTTDGSEPTQTVYSMPFWIEKEATIKACAEGNGYTRSEVAEATVVLKHQASQPIINVKQENGASIVTLESTAEGASLFYNYSASNDSTKSTKYTGPITIMKERELTAFAASQNLVASEVVTQNILVENPITFTETLAHMDAAKDPYYTKQYNMQQEGTASNTNSNSSVAYFFSWGKTKTAYPYYDTTADPISTTVDPESGDEVNVYPKNAEEKFDFENGWAIRSRGQIIVVETNISAGTTVAGDGSRDGKSVSGSYNPATVDEFEFAEQYPCTSVYLNLSEWNTNGGDPRSAMIYTTQKFKGPFAILSYISNGNGGTGPSIVFETGTDIDGDAAETEWNQIGDTCVINQGQRLYKKFIRVYDGTDEVYVRARHADGGSKAGFYDIYILGLDANSSYFTGIEQVENTEDKQNGGAAIYSLDGVRRSSMQSGLNIVVDGQGNAKKVMVK